jgi:hypothetical protein
MVAGAAIEQWERGPQERRKMVAGAAIEQWERGPQDGRRVDGTALTRASWFAQGRQKTHREGMETKRHDGAYAKAEPEMNIERPRPCGRQQEP